VHGPDELRGGTGSDDNDFLATFDGQDNPNQFFVFTFDDTDLPDFVPQRFRQHRDDDDDR
jgi:hypothetical protein